MTAGSNLKLEHLPLYTAVFAQPWGDERRRSLSDWLAPWQLSATGATDLGSSEAGPPAFPGFLDTRLAEFVDARIDFDQAAFVYTWEWVGWNGELRKGEGQKGLASFSFRPPNIALGSSPEFSPPGDLSQEAKDAVESQATWVWTTMTKELNERIAAEKAVLKARKLSPLNGFDPVPPDVWQHFEMTDWDLGIATCEATGERLFSVSLAFLPGASETVGDREKRIDGLTQTHMLAASLGAPMTVKETREACRHWGLTQPEGEEIRRKLPPGAKLLSNPTHEQGEQMKKAREVAGFKMSPR